MAGAQRAHEQGDRHRGCQVRRAFVAGRRECPGERDGVMDTADSTEIVSCRNTRCGQQLRIPTGEVLQVTCPTCGMSFTYKPSHTPGEQTKGLSPEFQRKAWVMAELMLMIARESMTLLKRNNQAVATKVSQKQEWEAFIEF